MRAIALLFLALVVLVLVGWITFTVSSDRAGVNIETEKVQQDTEQIIDAGRELVIDAGESLDDATDDRPADEGVDRYDAQDVDRDADPVTENADPVIDNNVE